jgi:hypothetical protein
MATVMKLEPIRMGDLLKNSEPSTKYVPPSRRGTEQADKLDMGDKNFPSLGPATKKVSAWGKTAEPSTPVKTGPSLSDKIKEKLRLDALEEEERARVPESDVWKMTRGQLQAGGWDILSLGETNVQEESKLLRTYSFTQEGLSFYDYTYYLRKPTKTRVVEVGPAVIQEELEDLEDLEDIDEWE